MSEALPRPQWLGRLPYRWAHDLQRWRRAAVLAGTAPEAVWTLEHPPVITTGRRRVLGLDGVGCEVVPTERGGLATFHGPGQLVGYLILDVATRGGSVRGTVQAIEAGVITWLQGQGIAARRRSGHPGVWVGPDKICALGLHFSRGVSMHGFALNLDPDLSMFQRFEPCGIRDGGVTSYRVLQGRAPAPHEVADDVADEVLAAFVDTVRARDKRCVVSTGT